MLLRALLWSAGAILSFCLLAVCGKLLSQQVPVIQSIFVRALIGMGILLPILLIKKQAFNLACMPLHLLRHSCHFIGQLGWLLAFSYLSVAQVIALEFTVPVWVLLLAHFFLHDPISIKKLLAISLCMLAVWLIVQPGIEGWHPSVWMLLASAFFYALAHTAHQPLAQQVPAFTIIVMMTVLQGLLCLPFIFFVWQPQPWIFYLYMAGLGVFALLGHYCLSQALRLMPVSTVMNLDFLRLPLMMGLGYLLFNEAVSISLLLGGLLMIAANMLLLYKPANKQARN